MKNTLLKIIGITWILLLGYPSFAQSESEKPVLQAPLFDNLGSYTHPVSTKVPLAQRFFDQGLILFYGFEWGESIRSFKEATRLDPQCGMCYWGLALALGNKINAPMNGHEYSDGKTAIQKALSLAAFETPVEKDYIKALSLRFQHTPKIIKQAGAFSCHASSSQQDEPSHKEKIAYANAMKKLVEKYPNDNDAKALYGAALYWGVSGTNPSYTDKYVVAATKILKEAMKKDKQHLGANHYFIHVTEPYSHPEDALYSANLLRTLVPGSEHLVHMPTHIYFLTGRYHEGTASNLQAIEAFKQYNKICREQGFEPEINYLYFHNYDFLRTTAAMEGRKELAIKAAKQIVAEPFPSWLKNESSLQWFIPIPYYVDARFGMWDEILKEPMPQDKYSYAVGMWHYARGMALAHTGNIQDSETEYKKLSKIISKGKTDSNLGDAGHNLLKISDAILAATLADVKGKEKLVLINLKKAMKIQHDMGYHEPPDWYFPVAQALGDAYLKWGHPQKAKEMYEQDLHQYPQNGWSLYGLAKSLRVLGENEKAARVEEEFKKAWKYADIPAPASLFQKN